MLDVSCNQLMCFHVIPPQASHTLLSAPRVALAPSAAAGQDSAKNVLKTPTAPEAPHAASPVTSRSTMLKRGPRSASDDRPALPRTTMR